MKLFGTRRHRWPALLDERSSRGGRWLILLTGRPHVPEILLVVPFLSLHSVVLVALVPTLLFHVLVLHGPSLGLGFSLSGLLLAGPATFISLFSNATAHDPLSPGISFSLSASLAHEDDSFVNHSRHDKLILLVDSDCSGLSRHHRCKNTCVE